jgi:3-dehydroquinate dehydratase-1
MDYKTLANKLSTRPSAVGTIHSSGSLAAALRLKPAALDFLELRVDSFIGQEKEILAKIPQLKIPLIVTVRDPKEGGAHPLRMAERRAAFQRFLDHAALIDVELGSAKSLADVIDDAHDRGTRVILSYHNFQTTPPLARLKSHAREAISHGGDILKIATSLATLKDMATLLTFAHEEKRIPLSLMGMGRYGRISRLVFAQGGSVLNYGYLDKPQVSGQWPALLLKERIAELTAV